MKNRAKLIRPRCGSIKIESRLRLASKVARSAEALEIAEANDEFFAMVGFDAAKNKGEFFIYSMPSMKAAIDH